jgi:DNA-binding CsgD family transcriptional regulator
VFDDRDWRKIPAVQIGQKKLGLYHYLSAPLLGGGRVVGSLATARGADQSSYGDRDLLVAGALCAHASIAMARLQAAPGTFALSEREAQIAELVAAGLTNELIGVALKISVNTVKATLKNMFRKLDVPSRAALVARLHG